MAYKYVGGQTVFESAGPHWHLVGHVRRDRKNHKALVLSRQIDELSPKIRAMNGRTLANVHITDVKGKSLNLSYAQVQLPAVQSSKTGKPSLPGHSNSITNGSAPLEDYSFVFQAITVNNVVGSTSTSDSWGGNG
jgi:type VI protein secretion system component Hcp